jgi:hypothetical protein
MFKLFIIINIDNLLVLITLWIKCGGIWCEDQSSKIRDEFDKYSEWIESFLFFENLQIVGEVQKEMELSQTVG